MPVDNTQPLAANQTIAPPPSIALPPAQQNAMPAAADPMAQFQDLAAPEQVSQLPAIGWWLLGIISLASIIWLGITIFQAYQRRKAKRQALNTLESTTKINQLNQLMKQALLSYVGRDKVANLSGQQWLELQINLLNTNKKRELKQGLSELHQALYQQEQNASPAQKCTVKAWLNAVLPISNQTITATLEKNHV